MSNEDQIKHMLTLYSFQKYFGHDQSSLNPKNDIARARNLTDYGQRDIAIMTQVQVMDWLSNCFVRASIGDVVAATTGLIRKEREVTFYIANNNGKIVSEEDKRCTESFLQDIRNLKAIDFSSDDNVRLGVKTILRHIVKFCWHRLHRKMTVLRDALGFDKVGKNVNDRFITLANKLHSEKLFKVEDFRHIRVGNESNEAYVLRGVNQMKTDFKNLILRIQDMDRKHNDAYFPRKDTEAIPYIEIDKLEDFEQAVRHCYSVLYPLDSIFVRNKPLLPVKGEDEEKEAKEKIALSRFARTMHNRLSRILKYNAGAQLFLTKSLNDYKERCKVTSASDISFKIVWVAESILAQGLPTKDDRKNYTKEELGAWLDAFKAGMEEEGKDINNDAFKLMKQRVTSAYFGPRGILSLNPSLHCELALMHYCDANAISPLYNVIGVSKLNCWSCHAYLGFYNIKLDNEGQSTIRYTLSGTSGKAHHKWYIPRHIGFKLHSKQGRKYAADVIESGDNAKLEAHEKLTEILRYKPSDQYSVGSDSSTASITINLLDQLLL